MAGWSGGGLTMIPPDLTEIAEHSSSINGALFPDPNLGLSFLNFGAFLVTPIAA